MLAIWFLPIALPVAVDFSLVVA